jgi:uncharacterized phage-associated protein
MTHDPRAIANLILAEAWVRGVEVSNLKLQKLLFLCHALHLVHKSKPLVHGSFEAWQYGPVSRIAYEAFRRYGERPITALAAQTNPATGKISELSIPNDLAILDTVRKVMEFYGSWSAGHLVALTHAKNGPWHFVVENSKVKANIGLRISDTVIRERFKYLWFGNKPTPQLAEPNEDRPLT